MLRSPHKMKVLLFSTVLLAHSFAATSFAAEEEAGKKPTRNEAIRAQMVEDTKKQAAKPTPPPTTKSTTAPQKAETPKATGTASTVGATAANSTTTAETAAEPATVLPQIEVNRGKVSPLARELFAKERELDREKQLTKSSELDQALNHPKVRTLRKGKGTRSRETAHQIERVGPGPQPSQGLRPTFRRSVDRLPLLHRKRAGQPSPGRSRSD